MFFKAKAKLQVRDMSENTASTNSLSIVSGGLSIEGKLISDGEIQVDGSVKGDIDCQVLTIGVSGLVVGEVIAEAVRVYGKVEGKIQAKSVFLASTASVFGDMLHDSLAIEPGASLEGHCKRLPEIEDVQLSGTVLKSRVVEKTPVKMPRIVKPFKKPVVPSIGTKPDALTN